MSLLRVAIIALLLGGLWPNVSVASFDDPVVIYPAPEGLGEIFFPGTRGIEDLELDYVQEEYFIEGSATVYTYNDPPVREEIIPLEENVPYRTRFIILRPANAEDFNGTVIIEWWNSTAGFDTAPVFDASAEYFGRTGIVYIGITNSSTSIDFLKAGCGLFGILPPTCGTRYSTLSIPENGVAYEMVSQLAYTLKHSVPANPLPHHFQPKLLFHAGQSQQGGSIVTYATAFHFHANDGYFIQAAGSARPINFKPRCIPGFSLPYPDCTPRLEGDARRVRTDLPVPVYRAQTETDMTGVLAGNTRQQDTVTFRYYEMAGTAHTTVHKGTEILPPELLPPDGLSLEDTCRSPFNTLADGPIFGSYLYNAMWENMAGHTTGKSLPPHGNLMETTPENTIARDQYGNALGGIRLPDMDVPVGFIRGVNFVVDTLPFFLQPLLDLFCRLSGVFIPFPQGLIDELYPTHHQYVSQYIHATDALEDAGYLLPRDASTLKHAADDSDIGGSGEQQFESVRPSGRSHKRSHRLRGNGQRRRNR